MMTLTLGINFTFAADIKTSDGTMAAGITSGDQNSMIETNLAGVISGNKSETEVTLVTASESLLQSDQAPQEFPVGDQTVDTEKISGLKCDIQATIIKCIIGKGIKYVYPYECNLLFDSEPIMEPEVIMMPLPFVSPFTSWISAASPIKVPVVSYMTGPNPEFNPDPQKESRKSETSCPCYCQVECETPVRKMKSFEMKTTCRDCKCLYHEPEVPCQCYDSFDLEMGHLIPELSQFIARHPLHQRKGFQSADETPSNQTITDDDTKSSE